MKAKIVYTLIIFLGLLLSLATFFYFDYLKHHPSTDDAYIEATHVQASSKVAGEIITLNISEGQHVKKGDLLFQVDPKFYALALDAARVKLAIAQKKASAILPLVEKKYLSKIEGDEVSTQLKAAQVELASAELNLSNTSYLSPISGYVAKLNVHQGDVIAPGTPLFVLIDNEHFWIKANFKETQLPYVRVGQKASVVVDMKPGQALSGTVASIGYGSQSSFSLLPAQNSTGTWVKITQRFPVRIDIQNPTPDLAMRVGASCAVTLQPYES